jgi:hypothetical protein
MENKELDQIKAKLLSNSVLTIEESYQYGDERETIGGFPVLNITFINGDTVELTLEGYSMDTIEAKNKRALERQEANRLRAKELVRNQRARVRANIRPNKTLLFP